MSVHILESDLLINGRIKQRVVFRRRAQLTLAGDTFLPVKTIDISPGGIDIVCPHPIQARQSCTLKIDTVVPDIPDLLIKGTSAYSVLSGMDGFKVGIRFGGMEEAMMGYIRRLMGALAI